MFGGSLNRVTVAVSEVQFHVPQLLAFAVTEAPGLATQPCPKSGVQSWLRANFKLLAGAIRNGSLGPMGSFCSWQVGEVVFWPLIGFLAVQ